MGSRGSIYGTLTIRPCYKFAWVIDGQHRLFAYSGMREAESASLNVLAFDGLPFDEHTKMFVDINSKQKKVPSSYLYELSADLGWMSADLNERLEAVVSRAVMKLDRLADSPFCGRIRKADDKRTDKRCITFSALVKELYSGRFFIVKRKGSEPVEYGALWAGNDNQSLLSRTEEVVIHWFDSIRKENEAWWDEGAMKEAGGLAMSDAVVSLLWVLESVFTHLAKRINSLPSLSSREICKVIEPYGNAVAEHLSSLTRQERRAFRELRGVQGQTSRMRQIQAGIRRRESEYSPEGLDEYLENIEQRTNERAKELVDKLEGLLQKKVLDKLKSHFGSSSDEEWFWNGIPSIIRKKVLERLNEHKGKIGKEGLFDLLDYKKIILANWTALQFDKQFSVGLSGNKEAKTSWIDEVNEIRRVVAHKSKATVLPVPREDVEKLETYWSELEGRFIPDSSTVS